MRKATAPGCARSGPGGGITITFTCASPVRARAKGCVDQAPPPKGDGCADAERWVADILNPPPPDPNAKPPVKRREYVMADLPKQCATTLSR